MDSTLVQLINELLGAQAENARLQQENAMLRGQLNGQKPEQTQADTREAVRAHRDSDNAL